MRPAQPSIGQPLIARRPLLHTWTVADILDVSAVEVRRLIDSGDLAVVFDLALPGSSRRDVRILTQSVIDYTAGVKSDGCAEVELQRAVKLIFPAISKTNGVETVRAATIIRKFSCSHTHVHKLLDAGLLTQLAGSVRRSGPTGSPPVLFSSVVEFLRKRRIT